MGGLNLIRERRIGYDEHGQSIVSDEAYVKVSVSVLSFLRMFKGARLSAFFALALNEAEISLGHNAGLSIYEIAEQTDQSPRNILRAIQYLTQANFATEVDERGENDAKLYRVTGYAWFGDLRAKPSASNRGKAKRSPASNRGAYDKMSYHAENVIGMTKGAPVVVVSKSSNPDQSLELKQQQTAETREILRGAHVAEPWLSTLSGKVLPETARAWAEWIPNAPKSFTKPIGYLVKSLDHDPQATPPAAKEQEQREGWWDPQYAKFIHGNPEHAQYCREHPDLVDCDCGKDPSGEE